ncbi:fructosamine kinase family protein [Nocardioides marmotae]|uniref:Phosphotransferase n=1 Tax=Nocardioides marmotae TaxID=2663857 RepID=A0A6I3JF16_9ACTN|nr:fructosamine kinase family protein [Nocardioides marmotae]MCR6033057.1 phosphotransferase [Gordonia jinghuaiqii]MBC9732556.1 fructosamine kinase family protein [Nocardioides marmotae]MTB83675.1 phosphotransferase [Nocardioides marmotae]MTB96709.1 phosphotransferase [Nocardioides marmotae]QKE03078.1 phosphotransferase [Nocardioides marmotae]
MARQPLVARRAEGLLGAAVVATAPVAGGDTATATKLRLSNGTTALMKTMPHAPADFFEAEARGLRWLGEVEGGARVPEVLGVDSECLVMRWIEPGKQTADAAADLGRALAATHAAGAAAYGAGPGGEHRDTYIARLPLPNRPAPTWAEFYAVRRVLPYLKLARDRGAMTDEQAATVESVVGKLPALLPEEGPARLHGDLWNGNVVWGVDGVHLVDPAAYGGHREMDLAMLSLFGLPHLPKMIEAYAEVTPLTEGWEDRLALHQLFPLLVHACLFGGGYGPRAAAAAARYR